MAQNKKGAAGQKYRSYRVRVASLGAMFLIAIVFGLLASYRAGQRSVVVAVLPDLASPAAIAQAKQDITAQYLASSTQNCVDPATNVPYDGNAYFAKYLQVNAYANRATIRACNSNGELLAKINGKWVATEVNLNLSARANPVWAKACEAGDLLVPDTVVRPENASIDAANLRMCNALQNNQILRVQDL